MKKLTKNELSLLLYLENRAVDYGGRVKLEHMDTEDMQKAHEWDKSGFVKYGRIIVKDHNLAGTHWCELSEKAWKAAHKEREDRYKRIYAKRNWTKTIEKQTQ